MVLVELGSKLTNALKKMRSKPVIDKEVLKELLKEFGEALLSSDVPRKQIITLKVNVSKQVTSAVLESNVNKKQFIEKTCVLELIKLLQPKKEQFVPKKGESNVVMFVGLQGAGKTTSVTKMAYWYKRKGYSTAIVCADTFRAGAFDQVKQNSTKAGVPFYGSYSEIDPAVIAAEGVERFCKAGIEIIIVDTSGRHKQEDSLFAEMQAISANIEPDEVVFVMDSTIGQSAYSQASAFSSAVSVGSVILTKLDGNSKGGGAISAVAATQCPIAFIGNGEHFDNFEQFDANSFVSRLLGKWDIQGIMNLYNDAKTNFNEPEMMKRLMKGKFSLRDMKEQLQTVLNMGPGLLKMMPGMDKMLPQGSEGKSTEKIKQFMTLMDSMTDEEMDGDSNIFNESRIRRISRGAGVDRSCLVDLMNAFKPFKKLGGNLGKVANKAGVSDLNKLTPSQIASVMDPRTLKNFGGKSGLEGLMRDMQNMEPDEIQEKMSKLTNQMGNIGGSAGRKGRRRRL